MSVSIKYKGSEILNIPSGGDYKLNTSGKYLEDDIRITDELPTYTATITGSGNQYDCYVQLNSTKYYSAGTFTYQAGGNLSIHVTGQRSGGTIIIDGETVESGGTVNHTMTLPTGDIEIELTYGSSGEIEITTSGGGGGAAISVVDTLDSHGGTIRTITGVDISSDTVTAAHLEQGYTAHDAEGNSITGTLSPGGGGQYAWFGEGAEKVGTVVNRTINLKDDTGYDDWTASTTVTELIPADTDPYYSTTIDLSSYDYCFVTRGYIEPVYQSGTPTTYRTYRVCQYNMQYYYGVPNSSTTEQVINNLAGNAASASSSTGGSIQYFYNNGGHLTARSATQCGPLYMSGSPVFSITSVSTGVFSVTLKFPSFNAKCDTSRFTTERKAQVDSANTNYLISVDLYRVNRGNSLFSNIISQVCADLNAE